MEKLLFTIEGMSCSACSASVEKAVRRVEGVQRADVNLTEKTMVCELNLPASAEKIINAVEKAGFFASEQKADNPPANEANASEQSGLSVKKRLVISVVLCAALMYISMGDMAHLPGTAWLTEPSNTLFGAALQLLLALATAFINRIYYIRGVKSLWHRAANMDTLIATGSGVSLIYSTVMFLIMCTRASDTAEYSFYFDSAAMILTLVTLGKYLEERAKGKTGEALRKLTELQPQTVTVIRGTDEVAVSTQELTVGDVVAVRPGERIPVDGTIVQGETSVDTSALTGEGMPADVTLGDKVMSGTVNISGYIRIRADRVGADTMLSGIITLVREAGASKAPVARLADKVSGVFVPVVMTLAVIAFAVWMISGGGLAFSLKMGISVLVISCPCALGLATPVAVTAGIGRSAADGILITSAEALENIRKLDTVVFDKTGTLTLGAPHVTDVIPVNGESAEHLLQTAAAVEAGSEHPLAKAVLARYGKTPPAVQAFEAVFGKGVTAEHEGETCYVGSAGYMNEIGADVSQVADSARHYSEEGKTLLYVCSGTKLLGIIAAADKIRDTSREAVQSLKASGKAVVILSGDNRAAAENVGKTVGADKVIAEVLPADKERVIAQLKDEGRVVAMVGDGINDSPALTRADIGIAVAGGSDIAIGSADVILLNDDPRGVDEVLKTSVRTVRIIKQNLFWAFFYNALGIPVAAGALYPAFGIALSPMLAAAAMSVSSLFVVTNALRLYKKSRG